MESEGSPRQPTNLTNRKRDAALVNRHAGLLLHDIGQAYFGVDLAVVIADVGKTEMNAVGQFRTVNQDVSQFFLLVALDEPLKVVEEEALQAARFPDVFEKTRRSLSRLTICFDDLVSDTGDRANRAECMSALFLVADRHGEISVYTYNELQNYYAYKAKENSSIFACNWLKTKGFQAGINSALNRVS